MNNLPEELKEFKGIAKYDSFYYVYFLCNKEKIVYIGKTYESIRNRVIEHSKDKKFTDCYFLAFPNKDICSMKEKELIFKFKPRYNFKAKYPKVGQEIFYDDDVFKVAAIVDGYIITKAKKDRAPFAISIEEITGDSKHAST